MTLTQLEYVLAVDKHRHFVRAAGACFVTQPTLSQQLQKLESELGVVIFDRSKNPVLPTAEGQIVIHQAQVILRETARLKEKLSEQGKTLKGSFRLGVIPTLAPYLLPLFLTRFGQQYPEVELIVEEFKTEEILQFLGNDQIDAGILATPLHVEGIHERVLFYEPFSVFAAKNTPLLKRDKVRDNDIDGQDVWLLNEGHCLREQVIKICSLVGQKTSTHRKLHFESGNLETLKNLVSNGSGYTLLPYLATLTLTPQQRKLVREFVAPAPTREVSLVYSRSHHRRAIVDALAEVIVENLPTEGLSFKKTKALDVIPL